MSAFVRISALHNEDRLQGTINNLARGSSPAKLRIYDDSGTPDVPASITDDPVGLLLCEVVLEEPLGTLSGGLLHWAIPDDALILANGTAHWGRFFDGNGAASTDCSVSDAAGDGPIKLETVDLIAGGTLRVLSAVMS